MTETSALTLEYLNKRPRSAGQALSSMQSDEAAALLQTLTPKSAASAFLNIDAWPASTIFIKMNLASAVAILIELDYQYAIAILRLMDPSDSQPFIQAMPQRLQRSFKISLSFPEDTVGAQMTTAILTLLGDQTAFVAIEQFRLMRQPCVNTIFIIDQKRKLKGLVSPEILLCSSGEELLIDLMETQFTTLSARARLNTITSHEAWDDHVYLPVLNRNKYLIGALQRKIAQPREQTIQLTNKSAVSISASIASSFITSAAGLAELLVDPGSDSDPDKSAREQL